MKVSREIVAPSPVNGQGNKISENFLYFACASDLLQSRLLSGGGPSAKFIGIGVIKGRRFNFTQESRVWQGGITDIVPATDTDEVWGAVYHLDGKDSASLNKQKGANKSDSLYERISVTVEINGQPRLARSYSVSDSKRKSKLMKPSPQYKECLIRGAEQIGLPIKYVDT